MLLYRALIDKHFAHLQKKIIETAGRLLELAKKTNEDQTLDLRIKAANVEMIRKFKRIMDKKYCNC